MTGCLASKKVVFVDANSHHTACITEDGDTSLNMLLLDDGEISDGEQEGVKPSIAEEETKWVFLIYVVFSFAAGIKEMGSRFLNWKENRSNS